MYKKLIDIFFEKFVIYFCIFINYRKNNFYVKKNVLEVFLGLCNFEYWKDNFFFCLFLGIKFKFYVICGWFIDNVFNFVNCYYIWIYLYV